MSTKTLAKRARNVRKQLESKATSFGAAAAQFYDRNGHIVRLGANAGVAAIGTTLAAAATTTAGKVAALTVGTVGAVGVGFSMAECFARGWKQGAAARR